VLKRINEQLVNATERLRASTWLQVSVVVLSWVLFAFFYRFSPGAPAHRQTISDPSFWFPLTGIAFAIICSVKRRIAPLVFLNVLFAQGVELGQSIFSPRVLLTSASITLFFFAASLFFRRVLERGKATETIVQWFYFVLAVSLTSVAAAGTVAWAQLWAGHISGEGFWVLLFSRFLGYTVSLLTISACLFFYLGAKLRRPQEHDSPGTALHVIASRQKGVSPRAKLIELCIQFVSLPVIVWAIAITTNETEFELMSLLALPILWIAVRPWRKRMFPCLLFMNTSLAFMLDPPSSAELLLKKQVAMLLLTTSGLFLEALTTERSATREELAEQTLYLNALLQNNPLAIVVHGTDGRVNRTNPAFQRMFGFSEQEMAGRSIDEFVRSAEVSDDAAELTQRIVAGQPVHLTTSRYRKDGQSLRVELYGTPLIINERLAGGIGIYKDITEQVRLEEELLLSQKLTAVGQLAGGVAHDFNNILGIIQGYSESLLEKISETSSLRESVDEILHAAKRATALTRQLLAFSRKQVIQARTLELNDAVEEMAKMLVRLIGEDIELSIVPGPALGRIKADPSQLEQVLLNLAVNARDAMPTGGKLTIETGNVYLHEQYATTYAPVPPGRYVMLAVSDNGTGMSPEIRARIFDPFFTTKEKGQGTGLGLATVHGIVHQAGGYIRVDSEMGQGSTFRIFFPSVDEEASPSVEALPGNNKILRGTETILLLEDEPTFRKMTAEFLERAGYSVLVAESANEATRVAQLHPTTIHLMLSDVVMPDISGPQLARFISALRPGMQVLFMSGYTDGALEQKEILLQGVAFIQKPFSWSTLALKIRETLEVAATS
jgi:PAS domain S-box-containing protein